MLLAGQDEIDKYAATSRPTAFPSVINLNHLGRGASAATVRPSMKGQRSASPHCWRLEESPGWGAGTCARRQRRSAASCPSASTWPTSARHRRRSSTTNSPPIMTWVTSRPLAFYTIVGTESSMGLRCGWSTSMRIMSAFLPGSSDPRRSSQFSASAAPPVNRYNASQALRNTALPVSSRADYCAGSGEAPARSLPWSSAACAITRSSKIRRSSTVARSARVCSSLLVSSGRSWMS
jgi:hypothetical protein